MRGNLIGGMTGRREWRVVKTEVVGEPKKLGMWLYLDVPRRIVGSGCEGEVLRFVWFGQVTWQTAAKLSLSQSVMILPCFAQAMGEGNEYC